MELNLYLCFAVVMGAMARRVAEKVVDHFDGAVMVAQDYTELFGGELLAHFFELLAHRAVQLADALNGLFIEDLLEKHAPAVGGVALAAHVTGLLQPVDYAGDAAGRQPGQAGELPGGNRLVVADGIEALKLGGRQADLLGNSVREEHGEVTDVLLRDV